MTDYEVLDRLRAANPLPGGSTAPPVDEMLARLDVRSPRGLRQWRAVRRFAPVLTAAVAVGVIVVAFTTLRSGPRTTHASTQRRAPASVSKSVPAAPKGGMRGLVSVWSASFSSASNGVISLQQCLGCRNGNQTAHSTDLYWLATTTNAGLTWSLQQRRYYIQQPLFAGANGWAGGLQATGRQAAGIARYYVTHDGGHSWSVAPAAAPNEGGALVSIAGGEVWATGLSSHVAILHAPATADRLEATASQPIHGGYTNVEAIAAGPGSAYVANGDAPRQTFVTHDDGRSWQRIAAPCPQGDSGVPSAAYGETVWAICSSTQSQRTRLVRSTDGGRSWQQLNPPVPPTNAVQAVSARVAWMLTGNGQVWRTADAGVTWHAVWSATSSEPPSLRTRASAIVSGLSMLPRLSAQTATSASVLTLLIRGHTGRQAALTNLVLYRTSDGGRTWRPYAVPLGHR